MGFAGTITFGLFMAGWYMSSRILVAAKPPAIIRVDLPPPPEPRPAEPVAEPAKHEAAVRKNVEPRTGQMFLQLAAMGPQATVDYLQELAAKGIHPLVAPGPSENIKRILLGPYANSNEMNTAQSTLQGQGIQSMVRVY